jgi:glyoxylase-like metal-dependent hydrolase (beta-lactamase superfamily II)
LAAPVELAPGLWRWATRHPEWHPGRFGAEVACFALEAGDELLLIDPLLPEDDDAPVLDALDRLARRRAVAVLITIGYHVRSAEPLCDRYAGSLWGPASCASRLADPSRLQILDPGAPGPGGATAFAIGKPVRTERPLWLPSHGAVAFGDAVVTTPEGELRMWCQQELDERRLRFYREQFAPTLAPLADLPVDRVLVTHGRPVLENGAAALRQALASEPWTPLSRRAAPAG